MQGQIDGLKSNLADKDAQLKQAQQAAADAQAAAAKAQAAASAQQQAVSDNAAAVTTLQTTVTDLKGNQVSLATTVSDETAKIKKDIASPDVLHYKGITLTPGGFAAAETVYRTKATGGDIPTAFNALPYESADAYQLSEFYGSGRQSRVSLWPTAKPAGAPCAATTRLTGWAPASPPTTTSPTAMSSASASSGPRPRPTAAGPSPADKCGPSLPKTEGHLRRPQRQLTPLTIDPNYVAGFVWTRQYGFRVVKSFKNAAFGSPLRTRSSSTPPRWPATRPTPSSAAPAPTAATTTPPSAPARPPPPSSTTPTRETDSAGNTIDVAVPVYKTVNGCADIATISFNQAPDIIAKIAFDPGWGHYEIFGIAGFAHETVYPGETTNSNLYGGLKDIATGLLLRPPSPPPAILSTTAIVLGGSAAACAFPVIPKVLTFGAKGLFGPGVGRYGDSTLADVTANAWGGLEAIHNLSGLLTVEANPNPRLTLYLNYGGDYAGRDDYSNPTLTTLGAPSADFCPTTVGAFPCTTAPTAHRLPPAAHGAATGALPPQPL
jgi:hypothetical protein